MLTILAVIVAGNLFHNAMFQPESNKPKAETVAIRGLGPVAPEGLIMQHGWIVDTDLPIHKGGK